MKKFYLFLFILFVAFGCGGNKEKYHYDYILETDEDIIRPVSGTPEKWVYIIGGNLTGTYYVSPDGNNSNDGTREHPWGTPAFGASQISPGDTLVILPDSNRTRPILAGSDNLLTAIDLSGKSYVWIENLEITHNDNLSKEGKYFRDGIEILGEPSHHITLKNLYIHHIDEFGMNFQDVDTLNIIDCRIEYCGFGGLGGPAPEAGGWRNVVIRGCTLSYSGHYYQGTDGSSRPYDRPDGFGIEASSGPILIEKTIASHNYGDGLDSKAENTTISQCIVSNNSCDGVKLWGDNSKVINTLIYGRGDRNPEQTPWSPLLIHCEYKQNAKFEIINVTIDDTAGNNYLFYAQYDSGLPPIEITMKNTILCGRGGNSPVFVRGNCTFNALNNLFYLPRNEIILIYGDSTYTSSNIDKFGTGNIYGNPLFLKTAWGIEGDYHLSNGSPGIDKGTSDGAPPIDLDGNTRPIGAGIDIGCYER